MRTDDIFIGAVGTCLPDLVPAEHADGNTMTSAVVAGDTPAVDLALRAAKQAMHRWGHGPDRLAMLLYAEVYHSGPDGWSPQSYLQRHLVGGHVLAAGVRQGCNGVFGALELSAGYLRALPEPKAAMVVAADNFGSPLLNRWTTLDGFCMGDAATTLILSRDGGFARLLSVTSTTMPELEGMHRGDEPLHPAGVVMGRPLDFQSRMNAFLGGPTLSVELAAYWMKTLQEVVTRALDEAGIGTADVTRIALPNGPRAGRDVVLLALGLDEKISTWEYGRTVGHSANDQVLAFENLLARGEIGPGDHVLFVGIGPGVTLAAAVIQVLDRPQWTTT